VIAWSARSTKFRLRAILRAVKISVKNRNFVEAA
jgi:hypothetical protein